MLILICVVSTVFLLILLSSSLDDRGKQLEDVIEEIKTILEKTK